MKKRILHLIPAVCLALLSVTACDKKTEQGTDLQTDIKEKAWFMNEEYKTSENGNIEEAKIYSDEQYAVVTVKKFGDITIKLYPEYAPIAVENFIKLAQSGYYNDKKVHRVINDFMMQGGSKNGDGLSDADAETFGVEISPKMRHFYGALCMAKDGLGRIGSQFYIVNSKSTDQFQYFADNLENLEAQAEYSKQEYEAAQEYFKKGEIDEMNMLYYKNQYETSFGLYDMIKNATPETAEKYALIGGTTQLDGGYTVFGQTVDGFDVIDAVANVELGMSDNGEASVPKEDIIIESIVIKTN